MDQQRDGVLAHPARQRILEALENGKASPAQLAADLDMGLPRAAYHVAVLHGTGHIRPQNPQAGADAPEQPYEPTPQPSSPRRP